MGLSQLFVVISGIGSYIRVLPKVIMGLPARTCAPGTDRINIYISNFLLLSRNVMESVILGAMNALSLLLFDNVFMYCKISLLGNIVSTDRLIYC